MIDSTLWASALVGGVVGGLFVGFGVIRTVVRQSEKVSRLERRVSSMAAKLNLDLTPKLPRDVVELARSGKKLLAIKQLRTVQPELGLAEAKALVDDLDEAPM